MQNHFQQTQHSQSIHNVAISLQRAAVLFENHRTPESYKDLRDRLAYTLWCLNSSVWDNESPTAIYRLLATIETAEVLLADSGLSGKWKEFFKRARARRKTRWKKYKEQYKARKKIRRETRGKLGTRWKKMKALRKKQRSERRSMIRSHIKERKQDRLHTKSKVPLDRREMSAEEAARTAGAQAEADAPAGTDDASGNGASSAGSTTALAVPIYKRPIFLGGVALFLLAGFGIVLAKGKKSQKRSEKD